MLNSQLPMPERFKLAIRAAGFYATWYPKQWLSPFASVSGAGIDPVLSLDLVTRTTGRVDHRQALYGPQPFYKWVMNA